MNLLIVGGDSAEVFRQRMSRGKSRVDHWTGRKSRDLVRPIPTSIDTVVVVLDRVNHVLANRVRREASRRGLPVYFRKRRRLVDAGTRTVQDRLDPLRYREGS